MLSQRNHSVVPASRFLALLAASGSGGPESAGRLTNREAQPRGRGWRIPTLRPT